jgi:hypothetical protein
LGLYNRSLLIEAAGVELWLEISKLLFDESREHQDQRPATSLREKTDE